MDGIGRLLDTFFNAEVVYNLAEGVIGFIPYPATS